MLERVHEIRKSYEEEEEQIAEELESVDLGGPQCLSLYTDEDKKEILKTAIEVCREAKYNALLNFFISYVGANLDRLRDIPFNSPEADEYIRDIMGPFSVRAERDTDSPGGTRLIIKMYDVEIPVKGGLAGNGWEAAAAMPKSLLAYPAGDIIAMTDIAYGHVKRFRKIKNAAGDPEKARPDVLTVRNRYHGKLKNMFDEFVEQQDV